MNCHLRSLLNVQRLPLVAKPHNTPCLRCIATRNDTYKPVYRFPLIRVFSLVNRLKLYQTAITAAGLPSTVALNVAGIVSPDLVYATAAVGISGSIVLYTFGAMTDRFVGALYVDEAQENVKISYVDFWGRRVNVETAISDIVPFSDQPSALTDSFYSKLKRFNSKDVLRINLQYGTILQKDGFNKIFVRF